MIFVQNGLKSNSCTLADNPGKLISITELVKTMNKLSVRFCVFFAITICSPLASAWDSVGHRLSAAVALEFLNPEIESKILEILSAHPRYKEDFLDAIPSFLDANDSNQLRQWLLGQAAYWPDIARGLPDNERRRFNRSTWHYTDGAWVRGAADIQGNVYLNHSRFPDIPGEESHTITEESQAHNVSSALDYNTAVLTDSNAAMAERAVALCWVLHLVGDIHQPLHTGSMFSPNLFATGDRGGNAVAIEDSNLHSRWDQALRANGVAFELPLILQKISDNSAAESDALNSDWDQWMRESRLILLDSVYSPAMREAIENAELSGIELTSLHLDESYVNSMQEISRERLGLAGVRLANFFNKRIP